MALEFLWGQMENWYYKSSDYNVRAVRDGLSSLFVFTLGTGAGTVSSADGKINCGNDCFERYTSGINVVLHAADSSGSDFAGWSGGCSGTADCAITANGTAVVMARFEVAGVTTTTTSTPPTTTVPPSPPKISPIRSQIILPPSPAIPDSAGKLESRTPSRACLSLGFFIMRFEIKQTLTA